MKVFIKRLIALFSQIFLQQKCIFLVSHMRSGTSLLSNIILSNSSFYGIGESHIVYRNKSSIGGLIIKIARIRGSKGLASDFLFDKILHNERIDGDMSVIADNAKYVFMCRNPVEAIPSIVKVMSDLWCGDLNQKAIDYYCNRMVWMRRFAESVPADSIFFIEYENLLDSPNTVLSQLQSFFEIKEPFLLDYDVLHWVGQAGIGDPSDMIKTGRLIAKPRCKTDALNVPDEYLHAMYLYDSLRAYFYDSFEG